MGLGGKNSFFRVFFVGQDQFWTTFGGVKAQFLELSL